MKANEQQTYTLAPGEVLTITAASGVTGSVVRMSRSPGGDNQSVTAIAGATLNFGPYALWERFNVICTAGTLTVAQAVPEIDTDGTLAANSDNRLVSQKAIKTYVDAAATGIDVLAATAENDMIVAGASPFAWAKKTLAEVKTIFGFGTAAYTASTSYVTHALATAENDVLVGGPNPFGSFVKKTITEFKTILGLGTAAYTATTAYDAAGAAAGVIASSISDSDVTHCPDGNSVFDALALKLNISQAAPTILQLTEKTPVNAVAATGILTLTGNATHRNTVTVGAKTYKFQTAIGAGTAATGTLTLTQNAADNETVLIGTGANLRTYTYQNAIAGGGVAAHGHLTLTGNAVENETVVMGSGGTAKTYRWRDQIAGIAATKDALFSAVAANGETITIDTIAYIFKTALTEAKATGILTATANPQDGARVTIGSTTYTYRDTLAVAFDVKIGANAEASLLNLVRAITAGAGEGTLYGTGTTAHPSVTAAEGAGDTVDVTALAIGVAGNAVTSVEYSPGLSWGGATLTGGLDAVAHEVLVEATAEAEIDNLVACANAGAGAGTKYSTGETAHATVTVTKKDADEITATAITAGTAGNNIDIGETCAQVAWAGGAVKLSGGYATAVANDVIIGGTAELSIDNLVLTVAAVTGSGVNWGVGTVAHTTIGAAKTAADIFTATALSVGDAGNAEASTTTMTNATWGATTLAGGEGIETSYDVLIGASASASIDNLIAAINKAAGEGTTYGTGTLAHPDGTAAIGAGDTMGFTAAAIGDAGNLIETTTTVTGASWGAGTLANGDDADTANDVLIGALATDTIDNLILAINAGAGAGVNYGTATTINADVTAAIGDGDTMGATAKVKGVVGNAIPKSEDNANMDWDGVGAYLTGGVDGTVGVANETCADGSYFYHAIAANTIADANWRRVALGSAY